MWANVFNSLKYLTVTIFLLVLQFGCDTATSQSYRSVSDINDSQNISNDLTRVATLLWNRKPTPVELKALIEADSLRKKRDIIEYFSRWRHYEEILNSLKMIAPNRKGDLPRNSILTSLRQLKRLRSQT
jgi:hypothetical protein